MPESMVLCEICRKGFQAKRSTARYCGSTCRKFAHRARERMQSAKGPADVATEIESVWNIVNEFTRRFSAEDLGTSGADTGPLEEALEALNELLNPICQSCGDNPANGWDSYELCRRCEIQVHDLGCDQCGTRRPSVASDEMLCRKCETDNREETVAVG